MGLELKVSQDMALTMSDAQEIRANGNTVSTEVLDSIKAGDYWKDLWWIVRVRTAFQTSTEAKLSISLLRGDSLSVFEEIPGMTLEDAAAADLKAGEYLLARPIPQGMLRYLKTLYTVSPSSTGEFTAGSIDSFVTLRPNSIHE